MVIVCGFWRFVGERYEHVKKLCDLGRVNQNSEIEKRIYEYAKYFLEIKSTSNPHPCLKIRKLLCPH